MSPSNSTRWCPTPEQLMILEEMYRGGMRTPNASQIQKITAHLSLYGKIEGKNVFYWFQNHKARERQKLRRKLISKQLYQHQQQQLLLQEQQQLHFHHNHHHHLLPNNNFLSFSNGSHQSLHNSYDFLHQGGDYEAAATATQSIIKNNKYMMATWNNNDNNNPPNCMMMRKCCDDWMMMMKMRDATTTTTDDHHCRPCCNNNNKPLKTLQLFPITTSSSTLKDQTTTATATSGRPAESSLCLTCL